MSPWIVIKFLITAVLIVTISEVGKRNPFLGSLIASIPLVSYLSILWMRSEGVEIEKIAAHAYGVFWYVLPSLPFFLLFPWMLRRGIAFSISLAVSTVVMVVLYFAFMAFLRRIGIDV